MASFLTFVWRNRQQQEKFGGTDMKTAGRCGRRIGNHRDDELEETQHVTQTGSSSSSEDSATPIQSPSASMDESFDSFMTASSSFSYSDETMCIIPAPATPLGLRPRRTIASLRQLLQVPDDVDLTHELHGESAAGFNNAAPVVGSESKRTTTKTKTFTKTNGGCQGGSAAPSLGGMGLLVEERQTASEIITTTYLQSQPFQAQYQSHTATSAVSSGAATTSIASSPLRGRQTTFRQQVSSPMISTSSFYSRSSVSATPVAESPKLSMGRALTAVGALVVAENNTREQETLHGKSTSSRSATASLTFSHSSQAILPPFPITATANATAGFGRLLDPLPPRLDLGRGLHTDDEEDDGEEESFQYHRFSETPERPPRQSAQRYVALDTPESAASSLPSSPWKQQQQQHTPYHRHQQQQGYYYAYTQQQLQDVNVSFSSRIGLVEDNLRRGTPYNFDPIIAVNGDQLTAVSGISHSTGMPPNQEDEDDEAEEEEEEKEQVSLVSESFLSMDSTRHLQPRGAVVPVDPGNDVKLYGANNDHDVDDQIDDQENLLDSLIMERKRQNQRLAKERLLLDLLVRLRSNLDLVTEIEAVCEEEEEEENHGSRSLGRTSKSSLLKTSKDKEGLMIGYSREKADALKNFLQSVVHEMETAQPEEFYLSPSRISRYAQPHSDLRQSLEFLLCILGQGEARAEGSDKQWKCPRRVRFAMGLDPEPETPATARGGDTSLFSLPSDSSTTPHTSNVSIATTITTKLSPYDGNGCEAGADNYAVALRRTIVSIARFVQRLTLSCDQLLVSSTLPNGSFRATVSTCTETLIRATEEIKKTYLQLMAGVDYSHLTSLVFDDVFVLNTTSQYEAGKRPVNGIHFWQNHHPQQHDGGGILKNKIHPGLAHLHQTMNRPPVVTNTDRSISQRQLLCVFEDQTNMVLPPPSLASGMIGSSKQLQQLQATPSHGASRGTDDHPYRKRHDCNMFSPNTEDMRTVIDIGADDEDNGSDEEDDEEDEEEEQMPLNDLDPNTIAEEEDLRRCDLEASFDRGTVAKLNNESRDGAPCAHSEHDS